MALVVAASLTIAAGPAGAAEAVKSASTLRAHAVPATAQVRSVVVVSGTIAPRLPGSTVVLQEWTGKAWHDIAHHPMTGTGPFTFSIRAPKVPRLLLLRVTRAASASSRAVTGATLHIHVVVPLFAVAAKATAATVETGSPITVAGSVSRKAKGSVALQRLLGKTWHTIATAKLTVHSRYTVTAHAPAGAYTLRVVKAYTTTIAAGTSKTLHVTVLAPVLVTTTTLPPGKVTRAYSAPLAATGGAAPYSWTIGAGALPAGLSLGASGVVSGTPTATGTSSATLVVHDEFGAMASATLAVVVTRISGTVKAWGRNGGLLGNGTTADSSLPVDVTGLTGILGVAGGGFAADALSSDGTVSAWGPADLGNGTPGASTTAVPVSGLTGIVSISAGHTDGYALRGDGTLWGWGGNLTGQLGNSTTVESTSPTQVQLTGVLAVAGGYDTTYGLRNDGTVWAWGDATYGALGDGTTPFYDPIFTAHSATPTKVIGLPTVTAIAGGNLTGYALLADGTVRAWGYDGTGQLGNSPLANTGTPVAVSGLAGVTAIAAGDSSAYALKNDGTVWAWGANGQGELGDNSTTIRTAPVQVLGLTGVKAIAAGATSAYALLTDGTVMAWGSNALGSLGNGTTTDSHVPVAVTGLTRVLAISGGHSGSAYAVVESP